MNDTVVKGTHLNDHRSDDARFDELWLGTAVVFLHAEGVKRVCWPSIFRYEHQAEHGPEISSLPPADATAFKYVIAEGKNDAFLRLVARGCLYDPRHTGKPMGWSRVVGKRPGAKPEEGRS
jgi:hypothetical protein